MMRDTRTYHVRCDTKGCQAVFPSSHISGCSPNETREQAAAAGWTSQVGADFERDFCPKCTEALP